MAQRRVQAEAGLRIPVGGPVASPTDTFVRPGASKLEALANGLAELSPEVRRFSGVYSERANELARLEGETARRKLHEQGKTLVQAQKEGLIPNHENPFFMAGFKEQSGRVAADTWHGDFQAEAKEALKNATSMEDFDSFSKQHKQEWLEKNGGADREQFFESAYGFRADGYLQQERNEFANRLAKSLDSKWQDLHFAEVKRHVQNSAGKADWKDIAEAIDQLNSDMIAQGRNGTDINNVTAEAIAAAALEADLATDDEVLSLVKLVKAGPGGRLGDTKAASELFVKVTKDLEDKFWRTQERERTMSERRRQDRTREVSGQAVKLLLDNPHADLKPLMRANADIPEVQGVLAEIQNSNRSLSFKTDEALKGDLHSRIWVDVEGMPPVTEPLILAERARGRLTTQDADWLIDQMKKARDAKEGPNKTMFDDYFYKEAYKALEQQFGDPLTWGPDKAARAANAKAMFREQWWILNSSGEGSKMNAVQKNTWLQGLTESVKNSQAPDQMLFNPAPAADLKTPGGSQTKKLLPPEIQLENIELQGLLRGEIPPRLKKLGRTFSLSPQELADYAKQQIQLNKARMANEAAKKNQTQAKE